jgi:hypothetical protein
MVAPPDAISLRNIEPKAIRVSGSSKINVATFVQIERLNTRKVARNALVPRQAIREPDIELRGGFSSPRTLGWMQ